MNKRELEDELLQTAYETAETVEGGTCEVELQYDLVAECPHDDMTDEYTLTITYYPTRGKCLELASLSEFLAEFRDIEAGQETITHFLAHFLFAFFRPEWIEVELDGEHYGIRTTTSKRREQ